MGLLTEKEIGLPASVTGRADSALQARGFDGTKEACGSFSSVQRKSLAKCADPGLRAVVEGGEAGLGELGGVLEAEMFRLGRDYAENAYG